MNADESTARDAEAAAHRQRLVGGIETLTPQQQTAMALRFQEGMNMDEIAAVMKLPLAEVRVLFAQAFEHLWDLT